MNTQVLTRKPYFLDKDYIPPLENGDRLTREEFHRRYEAMPENVRAELIKGIVYMSSPVSAKNHGKPHARIMGVLAVYQLSTSGVDSLDNATYFARHDYEPQPDVVLRIEEALGGKSWINDEVTSKVRRNWSSKFRRQVFLMICTTNWTCMNKKGCRST